MMFDGYLHTYLANLGNPSYLDLAIYLSINPSIYLSINLSIYLSIDLSIYLSIYLSRF